MHGRVLLAVVALSCPVLAGCADGSADGSAAGAGTAAAASSPATAAAAPTPPPGLPSPGPPFGGPSPTGTADGAASGAASGGDPTGPGTSADCRPQAALNAQQTAAAERNPVFEALFTGRTATLRRALAGATKAQVNDASAAPPIVEAAANGCLAAVRLLLDAGADPNLFWTDGEVRSPIALQLAAQADDVPLVRLLLSRGAEVTAYGGDGTTATVAAASANSVGALEALLDAGASLSRRVPDPDYSSTPLEAAVRAPAPAAVDLLLERGAARSRSLLYPAIESGSLAVVRTLLAAGISPEQPVAPSSPYAFIGSTSPADYAASRGRTAIAAALRAAGG